LTVGSRTREKKQGRREIIKRRVKFLFSELNPTTVEGDFEVVEEPVRRTGREGKEVHSRWGGRGEQGAIMSFLS